MDATTADEKNQELEKLYERLPTLFERLRETHGDPELLITVRQILRDFGAINQLEKELLPPEELGKYQPLSFGRVYDMAASGGGDSSGAVEELKVANAAFAEENALLAETINNLNFQIASVRRNAAEEARAGLEAFSLEAVQGEVVGAREAVEAIGALLDRLAPGEAVAGKGLDERFLETLTGHADLSPDLLRTLPNEVSWIGRVMRKAGLGADAKDVAIVRQLLQAALEANRTLGQFQDLATTLQNRTTALHHLLETATFTADADTRHEGAYREVMAQVERLQGLLEAYEKKHKKLEDLDEVCAERRQKVADQGREIQRQQDLLRRQRDALEESDERLQEQIQELQTEEGKLARLRRTRAELEDELRAMGAVATGQAPENDPKLLQELTRERAKNARLREEFRRQKRIRAEARAEALERFEAANDGRLVEKLESELAEVRSVVADLDGRLTREKEASAALRQRAGTWVLTEEENEKELKKWKGRAALRASFVVAAATVTAAGGYIAAGALQALASTWAIHIGGIAALGGAIGFVSGLSSAMHDKEDWFSRPALGGLLGGVLGTMLAALSLPFVNMIVTSELKPERAQLVAQQDAFWSQQASFLKEGERSPYVVTRAHDGHFTPAFLSDTYKGKVVTFDYRDPAQATISVTEPVATRPAVPLTSPVDAARP
jgi:hypothetical protein